MPIVRRADERDSRDIFDWRNDELTVEMSHTTDVVEWDGHSRWFAASLTDHNKLLVICEEEITAEKVAVVRFDVEDDRALISINLSPLMRGKGKAKACLKDAIQYFISVYPNVGSIDAEIKSVNVASQRSFEGVGFELVKREADILVFEYSV